MSMWVGERVRLRRTTADDTPVLLRWAEDSESQRLGSTVTPPQSEARLREHTEEAAKEAPQGDNLSLIIALLDGTAIGSVQTRNADPRSGVFDYGIDLAAEQRGKGYGGEALAMLLRFYFDERRYEMANGQVFGFNEPSKRFHEKFGFQLEGTLPVPLRTLPAHYPHPPDTAPPAARLPSQG
jgi:RimJ/RimL family protein N-acetyltransferase